MHLQLTALSSQLGSGNEENSALAAQINQLTTSLRTAESRTSQLEQQIQQLRGQLSSKDKELEGHIKKLSGHERRVQELEGQLKELQSQIAAKESEVIALREGSQAEVALAAKRLLTAQKAASESAAKVSEIEGELVKAKAAQQEALAGGKSDTGGCGTHDLWPAVEPTVQQCAGYQQLRCILVCYRQMQEQVAEG
jgi:chromosome segregation ATPase